MAEEHYVRDWMTPDPVTITTTTTVKEAHWIINSKRIRRLPVLDENGKLVGIVSWGDVREARPSDATSVSIFEVEHVLARMPVEKIMSKNPYTIDPDASVGEAARLMHTHRITSLPVLEDDKIVGIITVSDVLRMVAAITGYGDE